MYWVLEDLKLDEVDVEDHPWEPVDAVAQSLDHTVAAAVEDVVVDRP